MFTAISIISEIFLTYEVYLLMRCFFKKCRLPRYGELLAYIVLYVMLTMPNLLLGIPIINLICSLSGEVLITVCYRGTWKKRILSGVFVFGIFTLSESIVALLTGYIKLDLFSTMEYYSLFAKICLPIVQFFIVLLVRNFKNIREGEDVPVSYWTISIALPILSIVLYVLFYRQPALHMVDLFFCVCIVFIINIFVFYLYDHQVDVYRVRQEKETLKLENQYQLSQLKLMNEIVEKSREQRHDFIKHISMISYMNEQKDTERLEKYLEEIQGSIEKGQKFVDTGNFVIDGILNYKIQEAVALEIPMEVDVQVPKDLELSVYDMNIILTNLLDNSIEAVGGLKNKQINIEISYSKSRLNIHISNPYDHVLKQENGRYVTTKEDSHEHGYGLKNIEKTVKKYDGTFEIQTAGNMFDVRVCVFL